MTTRPIRSDLARVRELDRPSVVAFREEIYPAAEPVVMRAVADDWPIVNAARKSPAAVGAYLREHAATMAVPTLNAESEVDGRFFYRDGGETFNFTRREEQLGTVLDALSSARVGGTTYIEASEMAQLFPGLHAANRLSHAPPSVEPKIWIGNRTVVPTHYDMLQNIACVASGERRFTLFPPTQTRNLYLGPMENTPSGAPVSMVQLDAIDDARYPRFAEAERHAMVADLRPGDAIFIPYMWWHQVESLGRFNVLINYWWNEYDVLGAPMDALLHTMLTVRELPPPMRRAWQALFAHLVFEEGEAAAAHLPEHVRGGMGRFTPRLRGRLWVAVFEAIKQRISRLSK